METTSLGLGSNASGFQNTSSGTYSHAEGRNNLVSGESSHVEGRINTVSGVASHAQGSNNTSTGDYSFTGGDNCQSSGSASLTMGQNNVSDGNYCIVIGSNADDNNFNNSFVFSDGSANTTASGVRTFNVRATGGIVFMLGTNNSVQIPISSSLHNNIGTWSYTPSTPSSWGSTVPSTVAEALDILADNNTIP
jgi:hypothetical protein